MAKPITLALQGGAAHGAFVWGALDRILEDERLQIEGISGTSSGSINAVVMASGLADGGREAARRKLERFWRRISEESENRRWTAGMALRLLRSRIVRISRKDAFFDVMKRILLPYDFDPFSMDPIRSVIGEVVDFEALRRDDTVKLFINATNVATNRNRIFHRADISADAVCASCCLPFLFDAVEIGGERYWDGGYMGNPTIYPLIYHCGSSDVVMVLTTPLGPREPLTNSAHILNRISQVSFTSAFMREMRAIAFVTNLLQRDLVSPEAGLRIIHMHAIAPPTGDPRFHANSRFNAEWDYFKALFEQGRTAATDWLAASADKIGHESSVDIETSFT